MSARSVRVVTLNLWGHHEPFQPRLEAAARGLAALSPDVMLLQEVRVLGEQPSTARMLADRMSGAYHLAYEAATRGEAGTWGPGSPAGEEGLAILSRFPIVESRARELPDARPRDRRILLSARLDVPAEKAAAAGPGGGGAAAAAAGGPVWAHTTHLHWRLADGCARERQVAAIDAALREAGEGALHLLAGDFNAPPDADEIRFLGGRTTLEGRRTHYQDAWARLHPGEPGWTWARANPQTAWLGWLDLDRRIDYVFVSTERPGGRGRVLDARIVLDRPDENGVLASDHFGVLADVQL